MVGLLVDHWAATMVEKLAVSLVETMAGCWVELSAENLAGELAALSVVKTVALLGENLAVMLVGSKAGQTADE